MVLLETEATREVQVVARRSGKIAVAVAVAVVDADAAVVEAFDIVAVDIAYWVHEKLLYCFLLHERQA